MQGSASKLAAVLLMAAVVCLVGMPAGAEAWRGITIWSGHASKEVKATASVAPFDAQETDGNGSRRLLTFTPVSAGYQLLS